MNGKQARALRKVAKAHITDEVRLKQGIKILKEGFKLFKRTKGGNTK